jgi:hypothetical protein
MTSSSKLKDIEKLLIMKQTVKPIIDLIEQRLKTRRTMLDTLVIQPVDNVPESIKKMREEESSKIRAVIQEQEDLLATIKVLYPNG